MHVRKSEEMRTTKARAKTKSFNESFPIASFLMQCTPGCEIYIYNPLRIFLVKQNEKNIFSRCQPVNQNKNK